MGGWGVGWGLAGWGGGGGLGGSYCIQPPVRCSHAHGAGGFGQAMTGGSTMSRPTRPSRWCCRQGAMARSAYGTFAGRRRRSTSHTATLGALFLLRRNASVQAAD